jgi:hypothetical protein
VLSWSLFTFSESNLGNFHIKIEMSTNQYPDIFERSEELRRKTKRNEQGGRE